MIKVREFNYQDILQNINLDISDGDFVNIIGENGSGKTTLVKCILGLNSVDNNKILIDNKDINEYKKFNFIGYIPQVNKNKYELPITVMEFLSLINDDKYEIKKILKLLKINDLVNKNINILSGGQRQKVNIAKSLLHNIKYLILDEPENGLDKKSKYDLYETLNKLNEKITIILISHNITKYDVKINKIYDLNNKDRGLYNV